MDPLQDWDVDFEGVYMVVPDLGTRTLLLRDLEAPHKLLFSLDDDVLFVGQREGILAFDVRDGESNFGPGRLDPGARRWFWRAGEQGSVAPDGMKMDVLGNVYIGGRKGVLVISAEGRLLGRFFMTNQALHRLPVNVPGVPIPAPTGDQPASKARP